MQNEFELWVKDTFTFKWHLAGFFESVSKAREGLKAHLSFDDYRIVDVRTCK